MRQMEKGDRAGREPDCRGQAGCVSDVPNADYQQGLVYASLAFRDLNQAMPFMQRTTSRAIDTKVVEIDFANVQLLAEETMASVTKSGVTPSMIATAPFSR